MYMSLTAADHLAHIGFPPDYTVDGILAYGTWGLYTEDAQLPHLRAALDELGADYRLERIEKPIIGHAYELLIANLRYWFVPVMGTAIMANYLHLGSVLGSKRTVLLGIVGGLGRGMKSGDLLIPTAIIGNDSARMYDRTNVTGMYRPNRELLNTLRGSTLLTDINYWSGTTTTCEMMLAETQEDVDAWSDSGILGVEMEGALTFALSDHFGVPSAALFYVADNLIEQETMLSDVHKSQRSIREETRTLQYRLGLELLLA